MPRKYVNVQYDDATQQQLREWCKKNGFDLTVKFGGATQKPADFDFHTTIFHSVNSVNLGNSVTNCKTPGIARVSGYKLLGEDNNIPVLIVTSKDIMSIRNYYDTVGLEDKWPDYIPHISLTYAPNPPDISKIPLPSFQLKFDKIVVEDVL